MNHRARLLCLPILFVGFATAQAEELRPIQIVLAGDSTVASGKEGNYVGWGQFFPNFLSEQAAVTNRASSGTGTKWWQMNWNELVLRPRPDYVFIQLGHNDAEPKESDAGPGAFESGLRDLVSQAQAERIRVVLITPVAIRAWTPKGEYIDPLAKRAAVVRKVATDLYVPLIDLHAASIAYVKQLGPVESRKLGHGPTDGVHFSKAGATSMAELVAKELPRAVPELSGYLKTPSP